MVKKIRGKKYSMVPFCFRLSERKLNELHLVCEDDESVSDLLREAAYKLIDQRMRKMARN